MNRFVKRADVPLPAGGSTALDYFILGLVKDGGLSLRSFEALRIRRSFFWHAEQSQVYRALYRLRDIGCERVDRRARERAGTRPCIDHAAGSGALINGSRRSRRAADAVCGSVNLFANELPVRRDLDPRTPHPRSAGMPRGLSRASKTAISTRTQEQMSRTAAFHFRPHLAVRDRNRAVRNRVAAANTKRLPVMERRLKVREPCRSRRSRNAPR